MEKTVIGGKKYELKGVTYHSGSPLSEGERWWNCNYKVVKIKEEQKVVSEDACILFYK